MKKYELTDITCKTVSGIILHQIKAMRDFGDVNSGDLGGWIEHEYNLEHDGDCWVYDNARVFGKACISEDAQVIDNAMVYGAVMILASSRISGDSIIYGFGEDC